MSLTLNTAAMQYKDSGQSSWSPLTLTANADITSLAAAFDSSSTYVVGEYVRHDCRIYRCISAVTTAGAWNASNWLEVNLGDEFASLKVGITDRYGVVMQDTTPTDPEINGWLDTSSTVVEQIPQIDDTQTSSVDTYSSSKIESTYLSYDSAQSLTAAQTIQAFSNMGFLSGNSYIKFPNGLLIQYGITSFSSLSSGFLSTTITFGQAFVDTSFYVIATPSRNGLAYITSPVCDCNVSANITHTKTTAVISAKGTNVNCGFNWLAIGRWK